MIEARASFMTSIPAPIVAMVQYMLDAELIHAGTRQRASQKPSLFQKAVKQEIARRNLRPSPDARWQAAD